jgi:hypothetical protein
MREAGSRRDGDRSQITIEGTEAEIDALRALMAKTCWLSVDLKGALVRGELVKAPPEPADDPYLPPTWQKTDCEWRRQTAELISHIDPKEGWHHPSYLVQSLCGYGWTLERYRDEVYKMQSIGFECLRSRRKADGRFWEAWILPFASAAKGPLKDIIDALPKDRKWFQETESIVKWMCRNASFGTLDVMIQRAAMTMD